MSHSFSILSSGLLTQENYINILAQNITNLNTLGYKEKTAHFTELWGNNMDKYHTQIPLGVGLSEVKENTQQGPLMSSTHPFDVAIEGEGFFEVQDETGKTALTRIGQLAIDEDGYLAIREKRLTANILIPDDITQITIKENGDVYGESNRNQPQLLGHIPLVKPGTSNALIPQRNGFYDTPEGDVNRIITDENHAQIKQYQLEMSNVDMVSSLMQITKAQRIYQMNAKAFQIIQDMEKIINDLSH